jgi:hypothetical protein
MGFWDEGGTPGRLPIDPGDAKRVVSDGWTPPIYRETGIHMSGIGYMPGESAGLNLQPNVFYTRPPATPTYDRAWQGFQKENALALLQYGSRHPGMGPHVPGTDPPDSVYETNPMRLLSARFARVNKVPADAGAVGPGMAWMPNPSNPTASYAPQGAPSLWSTIWSRLFGG